VANTVGLGADGQDIIKRMQGSWRPLVIQLGPEAVHSLVCNGLAYRSFDSKSRLVLKLTEMGWSFGK
jgi:hypothetical protein